MVYYMEMLVELIEKVVHNIYAIRVSPYCNLISIYQDQATGSNFTEKHGGPEWKPIMK